MFFQIINEYIGPASVTYILEACDQDPHAWAFDEGHGNVDKVYDPYRCTYMFTIPFQGQFDVDPYPDEVLAAIKFIATGDFPIDALIYVDDELEASAVMGSHRNPDPYFARAIVYGKDLTYAVALHEVLDEDRSAIRFFGGKLHGLRVWVNWHRTTDHEFKVVRVGRPRMAISSEHDYITFELGENANCTAPSPEFVKIIYDILTDDRRFVFGEESNPFSLPF